MQKIDSFQGQYRFLSNFYPVSILYEGIRYRSTEHAYQAAKSLEPEKRRECSRLQSTSGAKAWGRMIDIRPDWENVKDQVMLDITRLKYQFPHLAKMLLDTGDAELIEGNTWGDDYWGVCRGHGQNKLGKTLMQVRGELSQRI